MQGRLKAALEVAQTTLDRQAAELEMTQRALVELEAATAEQKEKVLALSSENARLQAQQAESAAVLDSATKNAKKLERALEEQAAELSSAQRALADRDDPATAAKAPAAVTTSVSISEALSEPEWKDTVQAHHEAIPVALAIMDDLASVRLELEQWARELKLAAVASLQVIPLQGEGRRGRSIYHAELKQLVLQIAQEAALSSEEWRKATNGGKRVTSHNLRSVFMNLIDPQDTTSAKIFPNMAPFHPNDRCDEVVEGIGCVWGVGHPVRRQRYALNTAIIIIAESLSHNGKRSINFEH
jgi:hypothetical protein